MIKILSNQTMKGKSSISKLSNLAKEQDLIESILAYFILLKSGEMTKEELDTKCQEFIMEKEKLDYVDFDIEDSLKTLKEMELIKNEKQKFSAIKLNESIKIIKEYYKKMIFKEIEE